MFFMEEIRPCIRCGAPPRRRDVVETVNGYECHKMAEYCPVCDMETPLPFWLQRALVWALDHRLRVRFRQPWFGGRSYWRWQARRRVR